jgi:DNA-binding Lrp family transcriptional regulator
VSENANYLDETDRKIIQILQDNFPLVERPWKEVGDKLNLTEDNVINRLKRLNELGVSRKIGSIVDSSKIGLTAATLVAMKVPKNKVADVATAINEYGSVSHNYEREHEYNVWFTITASNNNELTSILREITKKTGIAQSDILNLPTKQRFKINVSFQLT